MITITITVALLLLHGFAVVSLLLYERRQPSATLAWVFALTLLPLLGLLAFFLFGLPRAIRVARRNAVVVRRVREVLERHQVHAHAGEGGDSTLDPRVESLLRLTSRLVRTPASRGNRSDILIDGRATYDAMIEAVRAARDHVHVEFYIIQPDESGRGMRDLLVETAQRGVEVRVVCDAVGSARLPRGFWQPLVDAGGKSAVFRPVAQILGKLPFRDRIDFRNHRKLVIVDSKVGFTGGINIGREYLGLDPAMGRWRDTHLRLEGPAVLELQKVFVEDWLHATDTLLEDVRYFPRPVTAGVDIVQIVDSGPDRRWSPIERAFTHAFALARDRLWIASPYFVPSPSVEDVITSAALRGVDVRLLVPQRNDSRLVALASNSYYPSLLEAGVRIFRYRRGFLHAKAMVVDDWLSCIGSANMDIRSFQLNYELNAFVFGSGTAKRLAEQFERDFSDTEELRPQKVSIPVRLLRASARMMSPLL